MTPFATILNRIIQKNLVKSVSCTTRAPRDGEENGREYFFISEREFRSRIQENDFLEYDEHFGNYYGTPRSFVERQLKDRSVILEIDVVGALNAKRLMPDKTVATNSNRRTSTITFSSTTIRGRPK